ncbi:MAG: CHAT domain-containing protein [Candidatus Eisenbacteria bacterium]|nr:CHAT domain-containing protein [Candidatus Eisenbacteria bacterium]
MTSTPRPRTRWTLTIAALLLGVVSACTSRPADDGLAGVPLSAELRPAIEGSRRSLGSADGGDERVRRDLERFDALTEMFNRAGQRATASDSLYALWSADFANPLWPELAAFHRNRLVDVRRFDALFEHPGFPDSASALGALLREWKRSAGPTDGSGFARAFAARDSLAPWPRVWAALRMSRQARLEGRAEEAAQLAIDALSEARALGGWRLELEAWLQAVRALKYGDHLDDALHAAAMAEALARAAARRAGNAYLVPLASLERAEALAARGEYRAALGLYGSCVDSALAHGLAGLAAESLVKSGIATTGFGDHEGAIALYQWSLSIALADQDSLSVPRIMANLASRHLELGNLDSSRAHLFRAAPWIDAYANPANKARFPLFLADYYARVGDFAKVDSLHAVAARLQPRFSPVVSLAELHLQIIRQATESGRFERAYRSIAELDSLRGRLGTSYGDRNELCDLELASARYFAMQGLYGRAAEALERAAVALERRPDPRRRWEWTRARGELARLRGDLATAEEAFREGMNLGLERGDRDQEVQSRLALAATQIDAGRYPDAKGTIAAGAGAAFGGRYRTQLTGLLLGAMAESRQGRFASALDELDRARKLCHPESPPDLLIRLELESGRALAGLGRRDEARRAYGIARERLSLARAGTTAPSGILLDESPRRELAEALLAIALPDSARELTDRAAVLRALEEAESLLPGWERALRRDHRRLAEPQLVFFVGSERSYRWEFSEGRVSLLRLPGESSLVRALSPVLADLRQAGREPVQAELDALAGALGGGVRDWPNGGTLTIVPDGPLFSVPWAALPGGGASGRQWIDRGAIVLAHAPVFASEDARPARAGARRLLAVGVDGSPGGRETGLAPLRHAEREAREVRALWPAELSTLRTGSAADRRAFTAGEMSLFDVIHVSSHALVYQGFSDRTSLLLAGTGNAPLTAAQIGDLELRAELVYLSCCEAGEGGRRGAGPAHAGLVRSFLAAGARCVIAPTARIEDEPARLFATRFYAHWLGGASIEGALRLAQLEARDSGPGRTRSYDWASYQANIE